MSPRSAIPAGRAWGTRTSLKESRNSAPDVKNDSRHPGDTRSRYATGFLAVTRGIWAKWLTGLRRYLFEGFVGSANPPWFDARGIAVGLAVGFGVPVGAQVVTLALLRALFRFNSVVAFAFTWVNNPFSIIPLYYGYYYLGAHLLNRPVAFTGETFRSLMVPILHADHFWQSLREFSSLGWDVLLCWSVTAALMAAISAILGYVIGLVVQRAHCRRKAVEMGITYEKLLARQEKSLRDREADDANPRDRAEAREDRSQNG